MNSRRWLLGSLSLLVIILCVASLLRLGLRHYFSTATQIGGNFTFCYPAPQMKSRAQMFRSSFVNGYLIPQNPFPVFTAMYQANMIPANHDDEKQLGSRGPFVFKTSNLLLNDVSKSGACASSAICTSAIFPVELAGATYPIRVDFPAIISVNVTNDSSLTFDFGNGIPFHVQDTSGSQIPLIRPDMWFNRVSISDSGIDEVISNPGSGHGDALQITIHLDLVDATCPNTANKAGGAK